MTPAVIAPKKAWIADGWDLGSIETVPIAFKLSNASSFKVFAPEDLILYDKKTIINTDLNSQLTRTNPISSKKERKLNASMENLQNVLLQ